MATPKNHDEPKAGDLSEAMGLAFRDLAAHDAKADCAILPALILGAGGSEEQAIACVLHYARSCGYAISLDEVTYRFGGNVATMLIRCAALALANLHPWENDGLCLPQAQRLVDRDDWPIVLAMNIVGATKLMRTRKNDEIIIDEASFVRAYCYYNDLRTAALLVSPGSMAMTLSDIVDGLGVDIEITS